jgi:poly(3-hydroxybutyrate) depolymerase
VYHLRAQYSCEIVGGLQLSNAVKCFAELLFNAPHFVCGLQTSSAASLSQMVAARVGGKSRIQGEWSTGTSQDIYNYWGFGGSHNAESSYYCWHAFNHKEQPVRQVENPFFNSFVLDILQHH